MIQPWLKQHGFKTQNLLEKYHYKKAQVELNGEQRRKSVLGSYRYIGPKSVPKTVWLFDDVITTGATLHAAADALRDAGVQEVHCLAFAWSSKEWPFHREFIISDERMTHFHLSTPNLYYSHEN